MHGRQYGKFISIRIIWFTGQETKHKRYVCNAFYLHSKASLQDLAMQLTSLLHACVLSKCPDSGNRHISPPSILRHDVNYMSVSFQPRCLYSCLESKSHGICQAAFLKYPVGKHVINYSRSSLLAQRQSDAVGRNNLLYTCIAFIQKKVHSCDIRTGF